MRILISGGEKSINIVNGIKSKFTASGDEFTVIPYIEDIPALYAKGDTFDKALITMESVTRDNAIKDETQLRQRLNAFALDASKRVKKSLYVFLSPIEEMANIMQEETLLIERYTAVLLKAKPYSVQFFVDILVKDVAQMPDGLIYKPSLIGAEQKFDTSLDVDDIEVEPQVIVHDNNGFEDDFDDFGSDDDNPDDFGDIDDIDEEFGLDDSFGAASTFDNNDEFSNVEFGNELGFSDNGEFNSDVQFGNGEFSSDEFGDEQFDDQFDNGEFSDEQFDAQFDNRQFNSNEFGDEQFNEQFDNGEFGAEQFNNDQFDNNEFSDGQFNDQFDNGEFGDEQFDNSQFNSDEFSNEQLNEEQFSNEGFEQSDEFGDEQFNDNNASSGEFPLSDDEEFQDNVYTSEDENAVQTGDEQFSGTDQSIYNDVDNQYSDNNEFEPNEAYDETQNIGFSSTSTDESMDNQLDASYSGIGDEYNSSQDEYSDAYDDNSDSNNINYNTNMDETQSDDFVSDTEDNFDEYTENGNQTDFYNENNTNEFNDTTFEENSSRAFNESIEENELYNEQYNQSSDSGNKVGLGGLGTGAAVAGAVAAGITLGKVSGTLDNVANAANIATGAGSTVVNTAGSILSKGLGLASHKLNNEGDGEMRISSNRGGSEGRHGNLSKNQQQTQQTANSDYIPGFDDDFDYDNMDTQQNQNEFNDYGQTTGYDDYSQDEFGQDAYEQDAMYQQSPAANTGLTGEELSDFSDEAYNEQVTNPINQIDQIGNVEQPQEQKKGLFGGMFGRGKKGNAAGAAILAGQVHNGIGNGLGGGYNTAVNNQNINTAGAPGQILDGKGRPANVNKVRDKLKPFAARGTAIAVTGFGGSGTSTVAYGLANILCQLGYSILLVDFDVIGRTQSYITRSCYDAVEPESANIMAAVNSTTGIDRQLSIVKEGFHLLTMGLGADVKPIEEMIKKEKLNRFFNTVKNKHQFVIYDLPFDYATGYCSEITYNSDNIVLVADSSTWGLGKMMIDVCNIANEDMQDTMFNRGQVVFNKYRNMKKLFGHSFRSAYDMLGILDRQVVDLVGDVGLHFSSMRVSGIIHDDPAVEDTYFTENNYSDTRKGQNIFLELVQNIVLNK